MKNYVDLIIPRGGKSLVKKVQKNLQLQLLDTTKVYVMSL